MMRLLSLSALVAVLLLSSCSKKSDPTPVTTKSNVGVVTINGTNYPTIIIGNQTWTSFNYNSGATGTFAINSTVYANYYSPAQAMQISLPTGWRIPTRNDFNNLLANFTSTKNSAGDYSGDISVARALADTSYHSLVSATNSSGFTALAGGEYDLKNTVFNDQGIDAIFLTSTTATVNSVAAVYFFGITSDNVNIGLVQLGYYASLDYNTSPYAYSLRFVKDN